MRDEAIAEYERLKAIPGSAAAAEKRKRGFAFEKLLEGILREEKT
jgi:hypothetical protein